MNIRPFQSLVAGEWVLHSDLDAAVHDARKESCDLETLLIKRYKVPEDIIRTALSDYYGCPAVESGLCAKPDSRLLKRLSIEYLKRNYWVPIKRADNLVEVVIDDPHNLDKTLDVQRAFPGLHVRFVVGLRRDIERVLLAATTSQPDASLSDILEELATDHLDEQDSEIPASLRENDNSIVRLANEIIADAYRLGASDVHIEPQPGKKETVVRYRIDGTCLQSMTVPAHCRRALISRFKIMANLDIAERRLPQDGKITFAPGEEQEIDVRVATVPTSAMNEDLVLRLLTGKQILPLDAMDLSQQDLTHLQRIAEKPYGMILCVGPTGSGKTTALHALLSCINTQERKIWTAEDPIEITQEGLRQVHVRPKIGFTFAAAMRAFLRADPDVIMIGEMRDKETADIALEASLTGHLVLSTLHTNSAVETVTRLLDLGCDAFNFADAMLGILAKRLCKRLCRECQEPYQPPREEYDELINAYGASWQKLGIQYEEGFKLFRGRGCLACNGTGFRGRIALHELLLCTETLRNLIQSKASPSQLLKSALAGGMTTLVQDGIHKVLNGQTTLLQVQRVAIK